MKSPTLSKIICIVALVSHPLALAEVPAPILQLASQLSLNSERCTQWKKLEPYLDGLSPFHTQEWISTLSKFGDSSKDCEAFDHYIAWAISDSNLASSAKSGSQEGHTVHIIRSRIEIQLSFRNTLPVLSQSGKQDKKASKVKKNSSASSSSSCVNALSVDKISALKKAIATARTFSSLQETTKRIKDYHKLEDKEGAVKFEQLKNEVELASHIYERLFTETNDLIGRVSPLNNQAFRDDISKAYTQWTSALKELKGERSEADKSAKFSFHTVPTPSQGFSFSKAFENDKTFKMLFQIQVQRLARRNTFFWLTGPSALIERTLKYQAQLDIPIEEADQAYKSFASLSATTVDPFLSAAIDAIKNPAQIHALSDEELPQDTMTKGLFYFCRPMAENSNLFVRTTVQIVDLQQPVPFLEKAELGFTPVITNFEIGLPQCK